MDDVLERGCVALDIGSTADGVVVECQHTDGVVHGIARISCHADDLTQQVVDIGIVVAPLYGIHASTVVEALERQFQVLVLRGEFHLGHLSLWISKGDNACPLVVIGLLGLVIHLALAVVKRQQGRWLVGRTKLAVGFHRDVLHTGDVTLVIELDAEVICLEAPRLLRTTPTQ